MDRIEELRQRAKEIADRADREDRDFTEAEERELDDLLTRLNRVDGERRAQRGRELERLFSDDGPSAPAQASSLGELVVSSEQYRQFRRQWPDGLPERGHVGQALAGVQFGGIHALLAMQAGLRLKQTDGGANIIGLPETDDGRIGSGLVGWMRPEYWGFPALPEWVIPPLMLRSLITVGRTTSDLIIYPQLVGVNNRAAFVRPGELKPESDLEFTTKTVPVGTLAHMLTVTRQALADVAQLRTYLDRFLLVGLDEVLERAILLGSPPDLTGIVNTPGILDQPFQGDILETARLAILKLQMEPGLYTQPTAFVLSPEDSAAIDLLRDSTGRFYGAGPFAMGPNVLWGLPRVINFLLPAGVGYVADWRQAVLWDREQGNISASDSHKDYFQRNLVAILAELRAAFGLLKPAAFCKFETQAGGTGASQAGGPPSTRPAQPGQQPQQPTPQPGVVPPGTPPMTGAQRRR